MSQSLVLGLYSYQLEPGNDYVLHSQKMGWKILEQLESIEHEDLIKKWKCIIES